MSSCLCCFVSGVGRQAVCAVLPEAERSLRHLLQEDPGLLPEGWQGHGQALTLHNQGATMSRVQIDKCHLVVW